MAAVGQHGYDVTPSVGALPLSLLPPSTDVVASPSWWDGYYYRCQLPLVAYAWQLMWARAALRAAKVVEPHQDVTPASVSTAVGRDDVRVEAVVRPPRRFHPYLLSQR